MAFRDSASFGKRQEYIAFGELLRRGFDVYQTMVDDQQIDCILRSSGSPPKYVDIQIKARSNSAKNSGMFSAMDIRDPRENFIFMFYSEAVDTYWIMPSLDLVNLGNTNKAGKHAGKVSINFTNRRVSGEVVPRPKWADYQNGFSILDGLLK